MESLLAEVLECFLLGNCFSRCTCSISSYNLLYITYNYEIDLDLFTISMRFANSFNFLFEISQVHLDIYVFMCS